MQALHSSVALNGWDLARTVIADVDRSRVLLALRRTRGPRRRRHGLSGVQPICLVVRVGHDPVDELAKVDLLLLLQLLDPLTRINTPIFECVGLERAF